MSPSRKNFGIYKRCECGRPKWPKCLHPWWFTFKPRGGGRRYRFSLDVELQRHLGSKTEAQEEAERIRLEIKAGTFRQPSAVPSTPVPAAPAVSLDQFAAIYIERASKACGKRTWGNDASMFVRLSAFPAVDGRRLGDWPVAAITEDTIEAFFATLADFAASTRNKYVQLLKASFRWAARKGYVPKSPISDDSTLKRSKHAQRRRRCLPAEEHALLAVAGVRLQWLIIAAIESCAREGELLAFQWRDVNLAKGTILIRAIEDGAKKTGISRLLPVSSRLAAVLDMARLDPAGREYPQTAYVFGELGERIASIDKAWETAVLKAHGHAPTWIKGGLSQESRAALRAIDLHFNDLRHEGGCRLLEKGWPLHHIQEMLGHANLSQTSTYLHAAEHGLQESMRRFDAARIDGTPVAQTPTIEHPPVSHGENEKDRKDLLH